MKNFYLANQGLGFAVGAYVEAVRKHEKIHSDRIERALQSGDPAKDAEKIYGKDEAKLHEDIR